MLITYTFKLIKLKCDNMLQMIQNNNLFSLSCLINSWKARVCLQGRCTRVQLARTWLATIDAATHASVTDLFSLDFRLGPIQAKICDFLLLKKKKKIALKPQFKIEIWKYKNN